MPFKSIGLLVFALLLASAVAGQAFSGDTLVWSESRLLRVSDFKGDSMDFTGLSGEAICMNLAYYEQPDSFSKPRFSVISVFDRSQSWLSRKTRSTNEILFFQVIFNLFELHARELRKELDQSAPGEDMTREFQRMYNQSLAVLSQEYYEFRKQAKMGKYKEVVSRWDEDVRKKIKDLDNFK